MLGILIIFGIPIGGYIYLNQDVNTYNKAVEFWNKGEIKESVEVAEKIPEGSRQYKKAQKLIKVAEDHLLYNKAIALWNECKYEEAVKIFESFTEESEYYKQAQSVLAEFVNSN